MKRDNLIKFETPKKPKGDSKLRQAMTKANKYDGLVAELKAYKASLEMDIEGLDEYKSRFTIGYIKGLRNGKKLAYEEAIKRINYFLRNEK